MVENHYKAFAETVKQGKGVYFFFKVSPEEDVSMARMCLNPRWDGFLTTN